MAIGTGLDAGAELPRWTLLAGCCRGAGLNRLGSPALFGPITQYRAADETRSRAQSLPRTAAQLTAHGSTQERPGHGTRTAGGCRHF